MMLDYIGESATASLIRNSVTSVIKEGIVRTYDMMRMQGRPEVVRHGAASTTEMTDAIIAGLKN
jgi:isocitrate dehydrogenase (NAD+)